MDSVLISGVPVVGVLDDHRFSDCNWSASALYRHKQRHLAGTVLRQARANATTGPADIIEKLTEALDDTAAVRGSALASGSTGLLLRAAAQQVAIANSLADRLGLDAIEVARELKESDRLIMALSWAIREQPDIGATVAKKLDLIDGADQLAADVRHVTTVAALALEGHTK